MPAVKREPEDEEGVSSGLPSTGRQSAGPDPEAKRRKVEPEEDKVSDTPLTHLVIAIDKSSSMLQCDVKTADGGKKTRWDAVFDIMAEFLEAQIDHNVDGGSAKLLVSLVAWNEE